MSRARVGDGLRTAMYLLAVVTAVTAPVLEAAGWGLAIARLAVGVVAGVAVVRRRRDPWWLPAVALLATPLIGPALIYIAVVSLVVRRRDRLAVLYTVAGALAVLLPTLWPSGVVQITTGGPDGPTTIDIVSLWGEALAHAVAVLVAYLFGVVIGTRRDLLASFKERAERAESERAARAREAVLLERARIAREMHDVLGHKISLLTMQAGALEVNADRGADAVEAEARRLRLTAREALGDLRLVIGALETTDGSGAPRTPGPGLAEIPALIEDYRAAGAVVDVEDRVTGRTDVERIDPVAGRAVHRVLTESLTNAHRHAPDRPVRVRLLLDDDTLELVVENPIDRGTTPNEGGTGLAGLTERVRLAGGSFEATRQGGLFRVRARFPSSPDSPTDPGGPP